MTREFASAFGWILFAWLFVMAIAACAIGLIVAVAAKGLGQHTDTGTDPAIMAQLRERNQRRQ